MHPAWYRNLSATPEVTVQIGPRVIKAHAVTVGPEERTRVFDGVKGQMKQFVGYEQKAQGREIPIVRLDSAERSGAPSIDEIGAR